MPATIIEEPITLKEACEFLGIAYSTGRSEYPFWQDHGVRILRRKENARPKFYRSDLAKMMEVKK